MTKNTGTAKLYDGTDLNLHCYFKELLKQNSRKNCFVFGSKVLIFYSRDLEN